MKKIRNKKEFSKMMIKVLTVYNITMTVWAFILYSCGISVPEGIVIALIGGLFGETSGYFLKAYFGKKNEEANILTRDLAEMNCPEEDENGN